MGDGTTSDTQIAAKWQELSEHQALLVLAGLRDIARGDWNRWRKPGKDLTAREHAQQVLRDAGIKVRP